MSENNIKLTYIPYSSMDEGFFQSIIEVADSSEYSSMPFILYNSELDINVETLDSVVNRYTEYIDENKEKLLSDLETKESLELFSRLAVSSLSTLRSK